MGPVDAERVEELGEEAIAERPKLLEGGDGDRLAETAARPVDEQQSVIG